MYGYSSSSKANACNIEQCTTGSKQAKVMKEIDLLIKYENAKREREVNNYLDKMAILNKLVKH